MLNTEKGSLLQKEKKRRGRKERKTEKKKAKSKINMPALKDVE